MKAIIGPYLEALAPGEPQGYCNLTLVPLLGPDQTDADYLLLDEALGLELLTVTEVSGAGSVPELRVENKAERPVLILDGEELVGAKQNRVVNTTLLIAAASTTVIPVSCVEEGRWSYDTPSFRSERRMMNADLRAMKAGQVHASLKRSSGYRSNQAALWHEISDKAARRDAFSPSMAMSSIYEKDRPLLDAYEKAFHPVPDQLGALFLVNGKAAGLDAYGRRRTLAATFPKLLRSYALDAVDRYDPREAPDPEKEAAAFLEDCRAARTESFDAAALGRDGRLSSDAVIGFALALEGRVLHLSVFSRRGETDRGPLRTRMARYTTRRRHAE